MKSIKDYLEVIMRGTPIVDKAIEDGFLQSREEQRKGSTAVSNIYPTTASWNGEKINIIKNPTDSQINHMLREGRSGYGNNGPRIIITPGNFYIGPNTVVHSNILDAVPELIKQERAGGYYDFYYNEMSFWQIDDKNKSIYFSESYSNAMDRLHSAQYVTLVGKWGESSEGMMYDGEYLKEEVATEKVRNILAAQIASIPANINSKYNFIFKKINHR